MAVSLKHAKKLIVRCIRAGLVAYVQGSPGLGKSAMANQVADEFKLQLIDVRLAQADPTDLNGFPAIVDGQATFLPFDTFPVEGTKLPEGKKGWLILFDELSSCPKSVQAASYKIILDRMVGQHKLDDKVFMMAAGNLMTDNAVVQPMSTALQSRMAHLVVAVNKDEWIDWATQSGIDSRITSFIEFRPQLLHKFDPKHTDLTFPCPRTYSMLNSVIKNEPSIPQEIHPLMDGIIGAGAAVEFRNFCAFYKEIPSITDILRDPTGVSIPNGSGMQFALSGMVSDHLTLDNADALMDFIPRLAIEKQVICIKRAYKNNNNITNNVKLDKWLDINSARFVS